jgi:hypothetical protein
MKRMLCAIILFSMMLHSASRLGVLSYLYKQRHEIAFQVGIIAEIPIALCSGEYHADTTLKIQDEETGKALPILSTAHEINLFIQETELAIQPVFTLIQDRKVTAFVIQSYISPALSIFHPPCEA